MLLPVWFPAYLHVGKVRPVMVDARTGGVLGERPYSAAKITLASVGGAPLTALVVLLVVVPRE
ncbi:hypothetical protein [Streptomyces sp. HF10]|uniref:hypothetical protein n=1 Tax=Streptomyces sp. HF10 TaxID=2692233 RepID=UPI0019155C8D|nr:hypothetical protein [Streptomyces sp. HF10]